MNIAEIATLGTQIAELGMKLTGLREKRNVLDAEIKEVEALITPLIMEHSKLIASIAGIALPPPPPPPSPFAHTGPTHVDHNPPQDTRNQQLKARIRMDLPKMSGMSAQDIADRLRVDSALVREVLREEFDKARARNAPGEMEVVPDGQ